jgi:succinate dehydrogenase/fumarate reductase flavoprotein subunit
VTAQDSRARQTECDLLVVGSGAGGLSAATTAAWHGLRVVVVEKDRVCGGATAWSGGWAWVPLNPLSQAEGVVEDLDRPRTYLKHVLGEHYDAARVDALLDAGRHMVAFFEQNTALQFVSGTWIADIQGHVPWASASWPDLTCRHSCMPPAPRRRSPTRAGGSGGMSMTWPPGGRVRSWSTARP